MQKDLPVGGGGLYGSLWEKLSIVAVYSRPRCVTVCDTAGKNLLQKVSFLNFYNLVWSYY